MAGCRQTAGKACDGREQPQNARMQAMLRSCAAVLLVGCWAAGRGVGQTPPLPQDPTRPAAALQPLASLVGCWQGAGEFREPGQTTRWQGDGRCQWELGGHWLQAEFVLRFDGMEVPLYQRLYFGHDPVRGGLVVVSLDSGGQLLLDDLRVQPDGALLQLGLRRQGTMDYAERIVRRLDATAMQLQVELLLPTGASMTVVAGRFAKVAALPAPELPLASFAGTAVPPSVRALHTCLGRYAVEGLVLPAAAEAGGGEPLAVQGTSTWRELFGGVLLHERRDAVLDGESSPWLAETWVGHDPRTGGLLAIELDNRGNLRQQQWRSTADGRAVIALAAGVGVDAARWERTVYQRDSNGRWRQRTSTVLRDEGPPVVVWHGAYARK
jgi:hypothetical protein